MTELILALDVLNKDEALNIAGVCAPYLDAIKIGYPLVLSAGLGVARDLARFGLPLIADFKVADIPNTNRLISEQVFNAGFHAVICQGFPGRDAVQACVESAHRHGGECYVVAEMSHPGAPEFFHGGIAERIAAIAVDCQADGIIAPATRPERIVELRKIIGAAKIYSPGVGAQGGDPSVVAGLVDGIIAGRQIYQAQNPEKEAEKLSSIRR
ncbi:MAG TPA: orotidine-5'-phosphate decarboxylase [Methanoregulaceae archaeon]|nr:orotidine-5'-phosphate decarboxylase [Methanoregulaceae archaeon]